MDVDSAALAAWDVLVGRGLIRIGWRGLLPVVLVDADLLPLALGRRDSSPRPGRTPDTTT